jgi:hypothetical protein
MGCPLISSQDLYVLSRKENVSDFQLHYGKCGSCNEEKFSLRVYDHRCNLGFTLEFHTGMRMDQISSILSNYGVPYDQ